MSHLDVKPMGVSKVGVTSGTTTFSQMRLGEEERLIAVESVAMLGGGIVLRGAPNRVPPHAGGQVRPAVVASLERSIRDHGDVWAELAKH